MGDVLHSEPVTDAHAEVAVRVVDADVHPWPRIKELIEYAPDSWRKRLYPTGHQRIPNYLYYDPPDWANAQAMRYDSKPPNGGYPGSDPDFAFKQLIGEGVVDVGILDPLGGDEIDGEIEHMRKVVLNDWLADRWLDRHNDHGRWRGSISVSTKAAADGAREIERWAGHPYMVQVLISPQGPLQFSDPSLDPIYAAASRHGFPVATHLMGLGPYELSHFPVGNAPHFHDFLAGWPLIFATHVMSLVFDGTFEKFPGLRFLFVEGAFSWVFPTMWRMDAIWEARRGDLPQVKRRPSEYVREHIRFTTQPLEDPERPGDYVKYLEWTEAAEVLLFSSDYPHWSFDDPTWAMKQFPKAARERIMCGNAIELYGLPQTVPAVRS